MSTILDNLKRVEEKLDKNYTSYQLLTALDQLIWQGCKPIIECSDFFDRIIANVLCWGSMNSRRKLSSLEKPKFYTMAFAFLASQDPKQKLTILKKMRLERNILFYAMRQFVALTSDLGPVPATGPLVYRLAITAPSKVWFASKSVAFWYDEASAFKGYIIEKYMRLVMMEANHFCKHQKEINPTLVFDIEDVAQNFILAVSKAIDKCDALQGTLTTYIQNWIKDAKGNPATRGEYGVAYSIPASQRKALATGKASSVNVSISLDDEAMQVAACQGVDTEYERQDYIEWVRKLTKKLDPLGISRMLMGIQEHLSSSEVELLSTVRTKP